MFSQMQGELPRFLIDAQNSPTYARVKKLLLVMLALWMTYFLVVNWFVHKLNKIAVPVLDMPLGTYLTFALWTSMIAIVMWVIALIFSLAGL